MERLKVAAERWKAEADHFRSQLENIQQSDLQLQLQQSQDLCIQWRQTAEKAKEQFIQSQSVSQAAYTNDMANLERDLKQEKATSQALRNENWTLKKYLATVDWSTLVYSKLQQMNKDMNGDPNVTWLR